MAMNKQNENLIQFMCIYIYHSYHAFELALGSNADKHQCLITGGYVNQVVTPMSPMSTPTIKRQISIMQIIPKIT